ncbi:hypothetical protein [Vibrio sp. HN007]|uniref:hypothetical protein n=1 Tax=Vibrio iocasae TaxID=3098914 RepID=UPI0035D4BBE4
MNNAVGRLTALQGDAAYSRHPLSTEAEALLGLRADLELLLSQGTVLSVNPYQFHVGNKLDSGCYLNPQTAIKVLTQKMRDHSDTHRPKGQLNVVAVMITASRLGQFATVLADIASICPTPDWCQVARQATALTTKETDKFYQPASIIQPRFKPSCSLNASPLREALNYQGSQVATLESLANDKTNVIGKLSVLAQKRADRLADISQQLNALKNLRGSVWSLSLTGNAESIASQLSQTTAPSNHQFTMASLLISNAPLTFFKELLC